MSLHDSVQAICRSLEVWAAYPKYAFERRVDILLTPFLEAYLSSELGGVAMLVAPEFPILASLRPKAKPVKPGARPPPAGLTVNVDYLFHIDRGGRGAWVLLELKTDRGSFDVDQHAIYEVARTGLRKKSPVNAKRLPSPMATLLAEVKKVERLTSKPGKYRALRKHVIGFRHAGDPIEVVYLAPTGMRGYSKATHGSPTRLLPLEEFSSLDRKGVPLEHADLWPHVALLLRRHLGLPCPSDI